MDRGKYFVYIHHFDQQTVLTAFALYLYLLQNTQSLHSRSLQK